MSAPRSRVGLLGLLFAGALAISAFTLRRGGAEFDEGLVLQAAARIADGQAPYADFAWPYGPAHPYLLGWSFDLLNPSLIGWRVLRSLVDAAVAVTVYLLARREGAPTWLAVTGWLVAACAMAQPTSATPFAPALLLALLAVLAATSGDTRRATLAAGLLTALAAAWRLDFGLYAGAAVVAALALRPAPGRDRLRAVVLYAATAAGLGLLAYLPFLVAVGPADLYDALVGASLRERDYWTLPFPLSYDGSLRAWPPSYAAEDGKDLLGFYAPLLAVAGLALLVLLGGLRARAEGRVAQSAAALAVLGGGCLAYLLSRADEFHATPLIVVLAAALPPAIAWASTGSPLRGARRSSRVAVTVAAAVFALLLAYGAANRVSALLRPPELAAIDLPIADGAEASPAEARALARMAAIVGRAVEPGAPIYTIARRSDLVRFNQPLVYLVADRPNPTRHDYAIQTSAADQRALVAELTRDRPRAIVRWTDLASTVREPNLRGRPTGVRLLDRWVADRYRLLARAGDYEILVPRAGR
ncbi:MAG TPA: hypothetical protein VFQ14_01335 [Thermoleophilaceae bacterium]|nr:hypothetical protein [Thermoleophilaceae bacterium]